MNAILVLSLGIGVLSLLLSIGNMVVDFPKQARRTDLT
jgi:hypothetical protein